MMIVTSMSFFVGATALITDVKSVARASKGCGGVTMDFSGFVKKYGRSYKVGTEEYKMRADLFEERVEAIQARNCVPDSSWAAAVNHLTDWTRAELASLRGHKSMRRSGAPESSPGGMPLLLAKKKPLPDSFSWAHLKTIAAPSEDQGQCGSCWAVASALAMRARAEVKGKANNFSTDQIIACTPNPHKCGGTGGCDGATAELAYEYVLRAGAVSDSDYSSRGFVKEECPDHLRVESEVATQGVLEADGSEVHLLSKAASGMRGREIGLLGWTKLPENKLEPIMRSLVESGPLYVAISVGDNMHYYESGVMDMSACEEFHTINHAVVLFGYGVAAEGKYWHIKNSWGPQWGEDGSFRLVRLEDEEGDCGWDSQPQEGSGCEGGPERVWVCGACDILYDAVAPHF